MLLILALFQRTDNTGLENLFTCEAVFYSIKLRAFFLSCSFCTLLSHAVFKFFGHFSFLDLRRNHKYYMLYSRHLDL